MNSPLWQPSEKRREQANISRFITYINSNYELDIEDYWQLYQFSITEKEKFWDSVWNFSSVIASDKGDIILQNPQSMPGANWYPNAKLNFAENLLRQRGDNPTIIFRGENKVELIYSHNMLYDAVSKTQQALINLGVNSGDRVAAYMPNRPETIIFMLAAASIGAIFSSCSPDFGVQGVVDRFEQIKPKVLLATNGYYYNGKTLNCYDKLVEIESKIQSLSEIIVVEYVENITCPEKEYPTFDEFINPFDAKEIDFKQLPFNHPLYIMFSSGTTGIPKCIVHSAGGTLLQHLKEHQLHSDVKPDDRLFYFTTCGWMMWNWLVSALASKAVVILYDGSPFYPNGNALFDYVEVHKINIFGTSAKYIEALQKHKITPAKDYDLSCLKTILSTGSPLSPQGFRYVYQQIKQDLCLSSISGGTDIVSCFALGVPTLAVWQGELQAIGLGMHVKVLNDDASECAQGEKGELACVSPFPSMPIGFWNDDCDEKFHEAYFAKIKNIWCHGDYVQITANKGMIIHGRSDAVLNPGGVRIGTAEIYRQVEKIDEVVESIVVGQRYKNDIRVVLFVKLRDSIVLDTNLKNKIRNTIRNNTTPRHVPSIIATVNDIPRTKSGKIVELAVAKIIHQEPIKNKEALANPEALEEFKNRIELK